MPAFGKNGMVNINQTSGKKTFMVVKPDGTVLASNLVSMEQAEAQKKLLAQSNGNDLKVVEKELKLI